MSYPYQGSGPPTGGGYRHGGGYDYSAPSQAQGYLHGADYGQYYPGPPGQYQPSLQQTNTNKPPQGVPAPHPYAANFGAHTAVEQQRLPPVAQNYDNRQQPYPHDEESHGYRSVESSYFSSHSRADNRKSQASDDADLKREKSYSKSSDKQCSSGSRDDRVSSRDSYHSDDWVSSGDSEASSSDSHSCDKDGKKSDGDWEADRLSRLDIDALLQDEWLKNILFAEISKATVNLKQSLKPTDKKSENYANVDDSSSRHKSWQAAQTSSSGDVPQKPKSILKRKTGEERVEVESKASTDSFNKLSALEKTLHLLRSKTSIEDPVSGSEKGSRGSEKPSDKPKGALRQLESYNDSGDDNEHAEKGPTKIQSKIKKIVPSPQPFWSVDAVPAVKDKDSELPDVQEQLYEQWRQSVNRSTKARQTTSKEQDMSKVDQLFKKTGQVHNFASSSQVKKVGGNDDEELDSTVQNILHSIGFNFDLSMRMQELARQKKKQDVLHTGMINQSASFLEQSEGLVQDVRDALFSDEQEKYQLDSLIKEARASMQTRPSYERSASPDVFSTEAQHGKKTYIRQGWSPEHDDGRSRMGIKSCEIRSERTVEKLENQGLKQVSSDEDEMDESRKISEKTKRLLYEMHAEIRQQPFSRERDVASPPHSKVLLEGSQKVKNVPHRSHEKSLWISERFRDEPKDEYFYPDDAESSKAAALSAAHSSKRKEISSSGSKSSLKLPLQSGSTRVENLRVTTRTVHADDKDEHFIEFRKVTMSSKSNIRVVSQSPEVKITRKRSASPLLIPLSKERRVFHEKEGYSDLYSFLKRPLKQNAPEISQALGLVTDSYYKSALSQTVFGRLNVGELQASGRNESPIMSDYLRRGSVKTSPDRHASRLPDRRMSRSPDRWKSRSPDRRMSRSSDRQMSRSPDRRMSRSPERRMVRSPERRKSKSADRRKSISLDRNKFRSPDRLRSRSPDRRKSPACLKAGSPPRVRSRFPTRRKSRTPVRHKSKSPVRRKSRSPVRRTSRSPVRCKSRSPGRRVSRSPGRRRSRSPSRRQKSRTRSPNRRRNLHERHRSPVRERCISPVKNEPSAFRGQQPLNQRQNANKGRNTRQLNTNRKTSFQEQGQVNVSRLSLAERKASLQKLLWDKVFPVVQKKELPQEQEKEPPKEHVKELPKEHVKELPKEHVKELPKEHVKELPKEHVKELPKEHVKELPKEQEKELPKEQEKELLKEEVKELPKEQEKDLSKEQEKEPKKEQEQQQEEDPSKISMKNDIQLAVEKLGDVPVGEREIILTKSQKRNKKRAARDRRHFLGGSNFHCETDFGKGNNSMSYRDSGPPMGGGYCDVDGYDYFAPSQAQGYPYEAGYDQYYPGPPDYPGQPWPGFLQEPNVPPYATNMPPEGFPRPHPYTSSGFNVYMDRPRPPCGPGYGQYYFGPRGYPGQPRPGFMPQPNVPPYVTNMPPQGVPVPRPNMTQMGAIERHRLLDNLMQKQAKVLSLKSEIRKLTQEQEDMMQQHSFMGINSSHLTENKKALVSLYKEVNRLLNTSYYLPPTADSTKTTQDPVGGSSSTNVGRETETSKDMKLEASEKADSKELSSLSEEMGTEFQGRVIRSRTKKDPDVKKDVADKEGSEPQQEHAKSATSSVTSVAGPVRYSNLIQLLVLELIDCGLAGHIQPVTRAAEESSLCQLTVFTPEESSDNDVTDETEDYPAVLQPAGSGDAIDEAKGPTPKHILTDSNSKDEADCNVQQPSEGKDPSMSGVDGDVEGTDSKMAAVSEKVDP